MARRRSSFGSIRRFKREDGSYKPGFYLRLRRKGMPDVVRWAGPDRKTAERFRAELERREARAELLGERPPAAATMNDLKPALLAQLDATHQPTTREGERGRFDRILSHFGTRLLRDIRRSDIEEFVNGLRKSRYSAKQKRSIETGPISIATRNRYLAALSVAFDIAVQHGYCVANPTAGVPRLGEQEPPIPYMSDEEIDRVIAASEEPRFRALLRVLVDTGLRRSEAARLEWRDVDFGRGTILVRKSKTKHAREVWMTDLVRDSLAGLVEGRATGSLGEASPVWPEFAGSLNAISNRFRRLTRRLRLRLRLHDLRHAFASLHAQSGTPLPTIQRMVGHTTPRMTFRYASHVPDGAMRDAMKRRDELRVQRAARKG